MLKLFSEITPDRTYNFWVRIAVVRLFCSNITWIPMVVTVVKAAHTFVSTSSFVNQIQRVNISIYKTIHFLEPINIRRIRFIGVCMCTFQIILRNFTFPHIFLLSLLERTTPSLV